MDVVAPAELGDSFPRDFDTHTPLRHLSGTISRLSIPRSSTIFTATRLCAHGSNGGDKSYCSIFLFVPPVGGSVFLPRAIRPPSLRASARRGSNVTHDSS